MFFAERATVAGWSQGDILEEKQHIIVIVLWTGNDAAIFKSINNAVMPPAVRFVTEINFFYPRGIFLGNALEVSFQKFGRRNTVTGAIDIIEKFIVLSEESLKRGALARRAGEKDRPGGLKMGTNLIESIQKVALDIF